MNEEFWNNFYNKNNVTLDHLHPLPASLSRKRILRTHQKNLLVLAVAMREILFIFCEKVLIHAILQSKKITKKIKRFLITIQRAFLHSM